MNKKPGQNEPLPTPVASANPRAEDVAKVAGVSQSAVSRALSGAPGVSEKTRQRIIKIAEELNYHPNALATGLITQRSGLVGVVVSDITNLFLNSILEKLLKRLKDNSQQALIFSAVTDSEIDKAAFDLTRYRVDGVFVISPHLSRKAAQRYARLGSVVLLFNASVPGLSSTSSVALDNRKAGEMIADFLVSNGHKKLAYIHGVKNSRTDLDRYEGFCDRLKVLGVGKPSSGYGNYTYEGVVETARRLLSASERPSAIFCANDMMAMGVMDTARFEFGLSVPDDLAVVGFDDVPSASWPSYRITSVKQPVEEMLDIGMDLMARHLEGEDNDPTDVVLEGKFVRRESA